MNVHANADLVCLSQRHTDRLRLEVKSIFLTILGIPKQATILGMIIGIPKQPQYLTSALQCELTIIHDPITDVTLSYISTL